MTNVDEFNRRECDKIDSNCVNAYVEFKLDPNNATGLCLDTSWGGDCLDLTSVVKAGETVTSLELSPTEDPNCLVFNREDGNSDCIHGDDLSRIISLSKLKDVDQSGELTNGDVFMYQNGQFVKFNLSSYMSGVTQTIDNLQAQITSLNGALQNVLQYFTVPQDLPSDAKIAFSNINLYSDKNAVVNSSGVATTLDKTHGIYGHALATELTDDELFG